MIFDYINDESNYVEFLPGQVILMLGATYDVGFQEYTFLFSKVVVKGYDKLNKEYVVIGNDNSLWTCKPRHLAKLSLKSELKKLKAKTKGELYEKYITEFPQG